MQSVSAAVPLPAAHQLKTFMMSSKLYKRWLFMHVNIFSGVVRVNQNSGEFHRENGFD